MAVPRTVASRGLFALIILACCGLMLAAAGGDDGMVGGDKLMMDRFLRFQATYNRSYPTAEERQRRFQVYRRNIEHIEATNRANLTYTLGENQFTDLTEQEFLDRYTMKGMPVRRDSGETLANVSFSSAVDAPVSVDWRSKGAVTPIKNQGADCASCWAFVTAATIESITQIRTGRLVSLSEQELVDCDMTNGGCNKGYFVRAYQWVINNGGLTTEANYPYRQQRVQCNKAKVAQSAAKISRCVQVPSGESNLMQAVAQQPIAGAIMMGGGLQSYRSGVFTGQCGSSMNHAITIVGYGAEGSQKYWLIKNSWGTSWGEQGYLRIKREVGNGGGYCGFASDLAYPVV